jgi:hypothetical protein
LIRRCVCFLLLIAAVPYKFHTVLTDNGLHFTDPRGESWKAIEIRELIARKQPFREWSARNRSAPTLGRIGND